MSWSKDKQSHDAAVFLGEVVLAAVGHHQDRLCLVHLLAASLGLQAHQMHLGLLVEVLFLGHQAVLLVFLGHQARLVYLGKIMPIVKEDSLVVLVHHLVDYSELNLLQPHRLASCKVKVERFTGFVFKLPSPFSSLASFYNVHLLQHR